MDALLLHLDEELTNEREGHSYGRHYSPEDLAYLIQLYSLFYGRVAVPANFLTDSNDTPAVLRTLGMSEESVLCQEDGPFTIVWDKRRFPQDSFTELVQEIESGRLPDVGCRRLDISRETALLCDRYLSHKVRGRDRTRDRIASQLTTEVQNDESVRLLKEEVFSPNENWARLDNLADYAHLNESLDRIVDRVGTKHQGYGRNFFYTAFGYGVRPADQIEARRFADITEPLDRWHLRHAFLTGVDYASNTIKAKAAGRILRSDVAAILPVEYQLEVRRPHTDAMWMNDLAIKEEHRYLIDDLAILNMNWKQLKSLRDSPEYRYFAATLDAVGEGFQDGQAERVAAMASALDDYLKRIEVTLNPMRLAGDRTIELCRQIHLTQLGVSVLLEMALPGRHGLLGGALAVGKFYVELITGRRLEPVTDWLASKTTRRRPTRYTQGIQLGKDIKARFVDHGC